MKIVLNYLGFLITCCGVAWLIFGNFYLFYISNMNVNPSETFTSLRVFTFPSLLAVTLGIIIGYFTSRKLCPYCASTVKEIALICPYCNKKLVIEEDTQDEPENDELETFESEPSGGRSFLQSEFGPSAIVRGDINWTQILELGYVERVAVMAAVDSICALPMFDLAHRLGIQLRTLEKFYDHAKRQVQDGKIRVEDLQTRISSKYYTAVETYIFDILEEET